MVDLRASMAEQIATVVSSASLNIQSSIIDHLARVEARIAQSKEEQDKFQIEIRSTLSSLKMTESTHQVGASSASSR